MPDLVVLGQHCSPTALLHDVVGVRNHIALYLPHVKHGVFQQQGSNQRLSRHEPTEKEEDCGGLMEG